RAGARGAPTRRRQVLPGSAPPHGSLCRHAAAKLQGYQRVPRGPELAWEPAGRGLPQWRCVRKEQTMSVSAVGSGGAYGYLQSILQQQSSAGGAGQDPLTTLLDAFYPGAASSSSSTSDPASGAAAAGGTSSAAPSGGPTLSPDTFGSLIALQGQSW